MGGDAAMAAAEAEVEAAAVKIQSVQRARQAKNDVKRKKEEVDAAKEAAETEAAAVKIQSAQRAKQAKKDVKRRKQLKKEAEEKPKAEALKGTPASATSEVEVHEKRNEPTPVS